MSDLPQILDDSDYQTKQSESPSANYSTANKMLDMPDDEKNQEYFSAVFQNNNTDEDLDEDDAEEQMDYINVQEEALSKKKNRRDQGAPALSDIEL